MNPRGLEVVAHIGVIGSGKDYRSDSLTACGYFKINFKDALLELCSDIAGYDVTDDYDWFKEHIVGMKRPDNKFLEAFANMTQKELLVKFPDLMTGRRLLVRLGTEGMRKRDINYWVNQWHVRALKNLTQGISVTAADCRFFNEIEAVRDCGYPSRFVFCNYKSSRYNPKLDHPSEHLAQALIRLGLEDGQEILPEHFQAVRAEVEALGAKA